MLNAAFVGLKFLVFFSWRKRASFCLQENDAKFMVTTLAGQHSAISTNRPFPSSLVPLFQNESKCETILMKMTSICMKMKLHAELIFILKKGFALRLVFKQRHKRFSDDFLTFCYWVRSNFDTFFKPGAQVLIER